MKFFTVLLVSFFVAFVLSSCSNVEQDYSPVAPEINKVSSLDLTGSYNYLQTFYEIEVESFGSSIGSADDTGLHITCQEKYWPGDIQSAFIVLEYSNLFQPARDEMVVLEKPKSNVLVLPNVSAENLKSVRVYYYSSDIGTVPQGLPDQTALENLKVGSWSTSGQSILVYTNDWTSAWSDCFVEIQLKYKNVLVYVSTPDEKQIIVPMFGKMGVTGVKLFGLFQQ